MGAQHSNRGRHSATGKPRYSVLPTPADISIDDPLPGLLRLYYDWPGASGVLAPGESATATAECTVTQADVDAGVVHNAATAEGTPPPTVDPEDPGHPVPSPPFETPPVHERTPLSPATAIHLIKTTDLDGAAEAGNVIEYTFAAANTGNVSLTDVTITDPLPGLSDLEFSWPGEAGVLAPGEAVDATASLVLTQADIGLGLVNNTATASGTPSPTYNPEDPADPPPQAPVTDQSTVTTELAPASGVELEKSSQQTGEGAIGDTVTYTFTAINTGNVTLTDVALRDDMDGLRDLRYQWTTTGQFAPGEAVTETATYEITQADLDAGEVLNLAIIVGRRPGW